LKVRRFRACVQKLSRYGSLVVTNDNKNLHLVGFASWDAFHRAVWSGDSQDSLDSFRIPTSLRLMMLVKTTCICPDSLRSEAIAAIMRGLTQTGPTEVPEKEWLEGQAALIEQNDSLWVGRVPRRLNPGSATERAIYAMARECHDGFAVWQGLALGLDKSVDARRERRQL
jgi:hypothetical protein